MLEYGYRDRGIGRLSIHYSTPHTHTHIHTPTFTHLYFMDYTVCTPIGENLPVSFLQHCRLVSL